MAQVAGKLCTALAVGLLLLLACSNDSGSTGDQPQGTTDLGTVADELSPVVDNPYVAFASVKRAVFEGEELEDGETLEIRMEYVVRDTPETIAGLQVTVIDVTEYGDGDLVERTEDYYAQDESGVVYYMGEKVADYEEGKLIGHEGQWLAGEKGARAGVFMPAAPKVGDVFEQERAPGVAEDRTTVIAVGQTVKVPAGTFTDCIEVEDFDPIGKTTQRKFYCRGVGLVKEDFGGGGSLNLIELETR